MPELPLMTAPTPPLPPADDRVVRRVLAFFGVIFAVLVAVVALAVRSLNRSELSADWVNHTHALILEIDGVLASAHAGDGALRTFVMTGEPRDQAASREAWSAMSEHLEIAKALARAEPAQQAELLQLETLANQRADVTQRVLTAWQADRAAAVRVLVAADAQAATLGEIRRVVEKLKAEEMALLAARDTASYLQAQSTRWTVWTGVALDFLLLGSVAWLIRDDIAARRRAAAALAEANAQLERKVSERTAELSAANTRLVAENLEQRWAQQAAEHQLRYYQIVFNSLNDLVFVVTKAMNVSRVNPAVVAVTGREPSALIDRPLASLVRLAGDAGAKLEPMTRALREGRELRAQDASIDDAHGRPTPVRLTLFPVRDRDKVVGGVVVLERLSLDSPAL
jgi:PAS domain S-box-containing protein